MPGVLLTLPDPPLEDDAIPLRAWTLEDIPAIAAACRDPEIPRWTSVPTPYTEDDAREWVERTTQAWNDGRSATFAVVERGSDAVVGSISLWIVRPNVGEFGYWCVREARGRGYTTRALRLVAQWAFDELRPVRLQLMTMIGNESSARVAVKVGFQREGTLRQYFDHRGEPRDVDMWSLLPGELRG